jgi:hypothetical protein
MASMILPHPFCKVGVIDCHWIAFVFSYRSGMNLVSVREASESEEAKYQPGVSQSSRDLRAVTRGLGVTSNHQRVESLRLGIGKDVNPT